MTPWIVAVFLAFFLGAYALETALALLNLRHVAAHGGAVPPPLAVRLDAQTARRSPAYTLAKGRFALLHGAYDAALTLAVLFSGLLPWLDAAVARALAAQRQRAAAQRWRRTAGAWGER